MSTTGSMTQADVYFWTGNVMAALRGTLDDLDFTEILPVILSERHEPGARHGVAVLGDQALPDISVKNEGRSEQVRVRRFHQNLPVQARFSRKRGRRRPVERRIPLPRCCSTPGTRPHSCSSSGPRRDDFLPRKRPLWRSDSNYEKFAGRARKGVPCLVMGSPSARVASLRRGLFTLSYSCRSPP